MILWDFLSSDNILGQFSQGKLSQEEAICFTDFCFAWCIVHTQDQIANEMFLVSLVHGICNSLVIGWHTSGWHWTSVCERMLLLCVCVCVGVCVAHLWCRILPERWLAGEQGCQSWLMLCVHKNADIPIFPHLLAVEMRRGKTKKRQKRKRS